MGSGLAGTAEAVADKTASKKIKDYFIHLFLIT